MDLQTVPVIDIAPFVNEDAATKRRVVAAVNRACEDIGFLVITGHGIESEACEQVFACARPFFALPVEEKLEVLKPEGHTSSAYHAFATEAYANKHLIRTPVDLRESFGMGRPDRPTGAFNRWPRRPAEFEAVFTEHYYRTERLAYDLARLFAAALELPEDYFADKLDRHDSAMVVHNYPEQVTEPLPGQLRTGLHSDVGFFTILRTEREHRPGGLQVQTRSGAWIDVPAVPYRDYARGELAEPSLAIRERVIAARLLQSSRLGSGRTNATMDSGQTRRLLPVDSAGSELLETAVDRDGLSPRAVSRIMKVARTIADLELAEQVQTRHVDEAIGLRLLDHGAGHL